MGAHLIQYDTKTVDLPVVNLKTGNRILLVVMPGEKTLKIDELHSLSNSNRVAMTGDVVNDPPALGAVLISTIRINVSINARFLMVKKNRVVHFENEPPHAVLLNNPE